MLVQISSVSETTCRVHTVVSDKRSDATMVQDKRLQFDIVGVREVFEIDFSRGLPHNSRLFTHMRQSQSDLSPTLTCPLCECATTVMIAHVTTTPSLKHYSCLRCASSACLRCIVAEQWAVDDHLAPVRS